MNWMPFPHPSDAFVYDAASLRAHWARLHAGDCEPFPVKPALVEAWIAFHAGDFYRAMKLGLAQGVCGYAVAHKATCVYASEVEEDLARKLALFDVVAERCERHQREEPDNPAAWYWQAFALGRTAQTISIVKALAKGLAPKVRHGLKHAIALAPDHADAWIGLGVYQSEIVGATGPLIASMTYGARKEDCHAACDTLDEHLRHVRARLAELQALEADLMALRSRCDGSDAQCHIIEALHQRADAQSSAPIAPGPAAGKRHV